MDTGGKAVEYDGACGHGSEGATVDIDFEVSEGSAGDGSGDRHVTAEAGSIGRGKYEGELVRFSNGFRLGYGAVDI